MHQGTVKPGLNGARWWQRARLCVVSMVAAALLGGCVIRVVYNQLDWLALWYVEDYFDLDARQEAQARAVIRRLLDWHRATQVPRYAELSRTLIAGIAGPVEPGSVAAWYAGILVLWDDLLREASPGAAALLQTLSDEQVADFFATLEDKNADLAADYSGLTPAVRRARQDKAIIRAFRRFTGRLNPEQEALIRGRTAGMHDLSADWLRRRAAWQGEFRALLAGRRSDPDFTRRVTDLLLNPNQFDSPGYRALVVDNQQRAFGMVAEVLGTLSPAQLNHLRTHLTTYAADFDALVHPRGTGTGGR